MAVSALTPLSERPSWRGWLHVGAFTAAVPAGLLLVLVADRASARVAASLYVASVLIGFGTSAAYHRLPRTERARRVMQRMDHSTIYVLIAGTYTPVCLLVLPPAWGVPLLVTVWTGAVLGIVVKVVAFDRLKTLGWTLYPVLGWAAVVAAPVLVTHMSSAELVLLVTGGLLYTAGIPVIALQRPDPWPRTFGYHEIWHGCTVAAGACHFAAVALMVG